VENRDKTDPGGNNHPVALTVAIPTYNGASKLPELLESLRSQQAATEFRWEVLIVDNNSTDNTAQVVREYQADWPEEFPLRYCQETQQGAAFARVRAIQDAHGELVGFLDDDTIPDANWVAAAYHFSQKYPQAGAYGSQIHGDYEGTPPPNFERIAGFLAITERGSQPFCYQPQKKILPPSAGLVVRKSAWQENVPTTPFLSGRFGQSMLNSEDLEAIMYIQNAGWEIWYNPDMELYHKIPSKRLQKEYLLALVRGTGLARHRIRMLRWKVWQRPFLFPLAWGKDILKAIVYYGKYRRRIQEDVVTACEMAFLTSSIVSPFYLWHRSFQLWRHSGNRHFSLTTRSDQSSSHQATSQI
jgi:glycosyltransferase involved in cell wall biosynthesis